MDADILLLAGVIAGNVSAGLFRCKLVVEDGAPSVIVTHVVSERRFDVTIAEKEED